MQREVSKGGIVRIPKTVFETFPQAQTSSPRARKGGGKVTSVVRLDGTVEEVVTGLPPNNPNFAPRAAWPGGKMLTNDKLEVPSKPSQHGVQHSDLAIPVAGPAEVL